MALRPEGRLAFTVEALAEDSVEVDDGLEEDDDEYEDGPTEQGWLMHMSGRYRHTRSYVLTTLSAHNFDIQTVRLRPALTLHGIPCSVLRPVPLCSARTVRHVMSN